MDIAARLIHILAVVFGLVSGNVAFAYGSQPKGPQPERVTYRFNSPDWGYFGTQGFESVGEACKFGEGIIGSASGTEATLRDVNGTTCNYTLKRNGSTVGGGAGSAQRVVDPPSVRCPDDSSVLSNGDCECKFGTKPGGNNDCVPYKCNAKGAYSPITQPDVKMSNAGDSFCDSGCSVTPSQWKVGADGQIWGVWPFKSDAKQCGGSTQANGAKSGSDNLPPAPVACGPNQCPGQINGVDVCVPCASNKTNGPSTAASGAQPGDPPSNPSDPDSAVKGSSESTQCVGATCTTTTIYKDGHGNEVGSSTKEEPREDYCQKNPQSSQCKQDSFGGACEGGFTCEGDAIQCALAKEVHQRNCQWFKDPPKSMTDAGDAALAGGDQPDWHPAKLADSKVFSLQSMLNQADPFAGGCPADRTFSIYGSSYSIPMSQLCPWLEIIGRCVVGMSLLAAVGIVFRGS